MTEPVYNATGDVFEPPDFEQPDDPAAEVETEKDKILRLQLDTLSGSLSDSVDLCNSLQKLSGGRREIALAKTKIQEARLWLGEVLKVD